MWDVLLDALIDTLKIFPFLIIAYILVEIFSYYFSSKLENGIMSKWAPVFGGVLGIIPQCGFSVVSADLYTRRFITIGTLFAVFLATSDEAILVLISSPEGIKALIPVIIIKLISAIVIGVLIDIIFAKRNKRLMSKAMMKQSQGVVAGENQAKVLCCDEKNRNANVNADMSAIVAVSEENGDINNANVDVGDLKHGCACGGCRGESENKWVQFLLMPFLHSLKIIAFILVINIVFGLIVYFIGEDNVINFLQSSTAFAPLFSALVGLVPNCASSVIITQLYILGGLNFASLVAGLCANVGIASLILFRKAKIKEAVIIITSLFVISVAIGYLLMLLKISF